MKLGLCQTGAGRCGVLLVNDRIDWRWGASYFENKLIDYDVCSNWEAGCMWQVSEMTQGKQVLQYSPAGQQL